MINLTQFKTREAQFADYLPWAAMVSPTTVFNKDGSFLATLRFRGPDVSTSPPEVRIAYRSRINDQLRRYGDGWALWFDRHHLAAATYPKSRWTNATAGILDNERAKTFTDAGRLFESTDYLSLCYSPPDDRTRRVAALFFDTAPDHIPAREAQQLLANFEQQTKELANTLSAFCPEATLLSGDDLYSYYGLTISLEKAHRRVPPVPMYLDYLLPDEG